jgi:zinc protease
MIGIRDHRRSLALAATLSAFIGAAGCDRAAPPADAPPAAAAPSASTLAPVTSVEGITEYRLDNGLRVLLFRDASNATMTVNVTYLVGSVHESYGETGMAHLLEHMLFKGSKNHTNIISELQDHGAQFNGSTAWDRTNYFETFDASDENLEWALELEADRMITSFVAKDALDTEMTVVRNEFEQGENSPTRVLFERVMNAAYTWHGYGRSPIGSRSDIENVPIERLQAFYRKFYQPDNAVLIVAGRFDEAKTLDLIAKHFGTIPKPQRELEENYTLEPVQDGEREVIVRRVGDVQLLMAAYHTPAGAHADFVPLQMAAAVLADAPSGRLYKALVETGLAAQVGVDTLQNKDPGLLIFFVTVPKERSLDAVRTALNKTLDELATKPITQEELERAKNDALSGFERAMNDSQGIALQLSEWAAMGDWRLMFLDRDRVRGATAEDAQRVALQYLKTSNRTIGLFIPGEPDRADIPPTPNLTTLLEGYKGDELRAEGEEFDPSPANIEMRTTRVDLPGGTKLLMLPKETRGDAVFASIALRIGDEESLRNTDGASSLTAQMLMRGTKSHTRQQIQDELDRLQSQLSISGSGGTVSLNVQSTRENLAAVLELGLEVLRDPAFPEAELETLRAAALAGIEQSRSQPQAIVQRAYSRHWSQYPRGDIRYVPTVDEEIERLRSMNVQRLREFHTGFYGASNAEVAIVGDFDADAIRALVAAKLDGWKSPKPYREVLSAFPNPAIAPVNEEFETPDKENAVFVAGMPIQMTDADADYPALVLGNYLLGGGPSSRLFERIRIKDGLSYGVGSQFQASALSDRAQFSAQAISAPQNAEKVEAAFREELENVLTEGFKADELANGQTSWAQARQVGRSDDGQLMGRLLGLMHVGRTMTWDADFEAKVQALNVEQVRAAMQRHLGADKMAFMLGGDFAGAKAE